MDSWHSESSMWGCLYRHIISTYRTFLAILATHRFCPHKLGALIRSHTVWFTSWCQLRTWSHWAHPCWLKMGKWALPCLTLCSLLVLPHTYPRPWPLYPRLGMSQGRNMLWLKHASEDKSVVPQAFFFIQLGLLLFLLKPYRHQALTWVFMPLCHRWSTVLGMVIRQV